MSGQLTNEPFQQVWTIGNYLLSSDYINRRGYRIMVGKSGVMAVCIACIVMCAAAGSEALQNPGPEIIPLKNGSIPLQFSHRKHQNLQNSECFHCHIPDRWKIDNWGKETAHSMCISCHDLNDKGPVKCEDCHT